MSATRAHDIDQFDRVVEAIAELSPVPPKPVTRGVRLCCPAHEDRTPSLDITHGDTQPVLIKCWAGCDTAEILDAAGLDWADVSLDKPAPLPTRPPMREIKRTAPPAVSKRIEYVYTDVDNTPLFRVVRQNRIDGTKRIHQERPVDGGVRWVPGITAKGTGEPLVPYVPYRLPRLVAGVAADALIFIVEGEKCVESLESLGFIATTNHGGAGKWRDDYSHYFQSARVVVLPDNDDAGRSHAQQVHDSLASVAASVTVLDIPGLPEKGDVADFVASGGSSAELRAMLTVSTAPAAPIPTRVPELAPEALYGPMGNIVRALEPTTEAAPVALLTQLITAYGVMLGRRPVAQIWNEPQHTVLYTVVTGASAAARKSTAARAVRPFLSILDPDFLVNNTEEGMASGEAIVDALRDDEAFPDKDTRMLINEDEFARLLEVTGRTGNTLSTVLLSAWDSTTLGVRTRGHGKQRVSDPHIGVVGNVPDAELRAAMHDFSSGFANRFLYVLADSPQDLPFPKSLSASEVTALSRPLHQALAWATECKREITLADNAYDTYEKLYRSHRAAQRAGTGRVTHLRAREISNLVRVALIYAVIDMSHVITVEHLRAAEAFIAYANDSLAILFGGNSYSERATRILETLRSAPRGEGLTRTQIRALYANNWESGQLEKTIAELTEAGIAVERSTSSGRGRPTQTLYLL